MKREIKFRSWNIKEKLMIDWSKMTFYLLFTCNDENHIIMQFTGLQDKNGKDIYEGDICLYGDFKRLICFEDGCFISIQYGLHGRIVITSPFGFNNLEGYHEVIGNIHENPELLNG